MEIQNYRKVEKTTLVKELAIGETFVFINHEGFDENDIFMKGDVGVVNLRTGYIYQGLSDDKVKVVKAMLIVE